MLATGPAIPRSSSGMQAFFSRIHQHAVAVDVP
jgi:hypothetical protein